MTCTDTPVAYTTLIQSVTTASHAVTKTSRVRSDPANATTNPKLIPVAGIEYCIAVANSVSAAATSVVITDPVPGQLTLNAGSILLGGTVTSGTCDFKDRKSVV